MIDPKIYFDRFLSWKRHTGGKQHSAAFEKGGKAALLFPPGLHKIVKTDICTVLAAFECPGNIMGYVENPVQSPTAYGIQYQRPKYIRKPYGGKRVAGTHKHGI